MTLLAAFEKVHPIASSTDCAVSTLVEVECILTIFERVSLSKPNKKTASTQFK